jgi:hypothetical protein
MQIGVPAVPKERCSELSRLDRQEPLFPDLNARPCGFLDQLQLGEAQQKRGRYSP